MNILSLDPMSALVALVLVTLLLCLVFFLLWQGVRTSLRALQAELANDKQRALDEQRDHQTQLEILREKHRQVELELSSAKAQLNEKMAVLANQSAELKSLTVIKEAHLQLQSRVEEKERQLKEREDLLSETKKSLFKEFELAAGKLFDTKQELFRQSSQQNLQTVLLPFKTQLEQFHKQIQDVYHHENTQRNQLVGQIVELQKQAHRISEDANNLALALKGDNRVQGQWGEVVLERLLEQSGLQKGREYEVQVSLRDSQGKLYRPDVVIHLPDEKDIVVDAKVTLLEYEKYSSAGSEVERDAALKRHVDAVKTHMKGLSLKAYAALEGLRTLDFIFMFIPIESAYIAAMQNAPALFSDAYERNIMIVSPSTLMVALRTVETMWRFEYQNANAEKIANSAGRLYDQFALAMASVEDVGIHLMRANKSHEEAFKRLTSGKGNVLKRIDDLRRLGAKTSRQLPKLTQEQLADDGDDGLALAETPPLTDDMSGDEEA